MAACKATGTSGPTGESKILYLEKCNGILTISLSIVTLKNTGTTSTIEAA